jgi:glycosyltransferase involved in cell wall biosynthesis
MKILFISNLYPPNALGGYERLCHSVAEALASRGHEIGVLTSTYGGLSAEYQGQKIWQSLYLLATEGNIYQPFDASEERRKEINGFNIHKLDSVINEFKPEIIFSWNLYFFDKSLLEHIEAHHSAKSVYFLTDNWLISFFNANFLSYFYSQVVFGAAQENEILKLSQPLKKLNARAIFGSRFMELFYKNAGIVFSDSRVIHNGVDLTASTEQMADRMHNIHYGRLKLLFAGRVVDVKGVETAIRALTLVIEKLPNVEVVLDIVGDCQDKNYKSKLEQIILENHLGSNVHFYDPVDPDKLFSLFQQYDIYLFPSLYEPFALTLIFALHAGIPTVASNVGGNPEIIIDNKTGLIFEKSDHGRMAEKIIDLYQRPLKRMQISRHARREAYKYNFHEMIKSIDYYLTESKQQ